MSLGRGLRAGAVCFVTPLSPELLSHSQSHAETVSSADTTLRHPAVCIVRSMIESMLGFIDSSFQSNKVLFWSTVLYNNNANESSMNHLAC